MIVSRIKSEQAWSQSTAARDGLCTVAASWAQSRVWCARLNFASGNDALLRGLGT